MPSELHCSALAIAVVGSSPGNLRNTWSLSEDMAHPVEAYTIFQLAIADMFLIEGALSKYVGDVEIKT